MAMITPKVTNMRQGHAASGSPSFNCGDIIAEALIGWPVERVRALAEKMDIDAERYEHLNHGHQRMILGQMFRKRLRDQDRAHRQDAGAKTGDDWFMALVEETLAEMPDEAA